MHVHICSCAVCCIHSLPSHSTIAFFCCSPISFFARFSPSISSLLSFSGTPQELKAKYGGGYELTLKLANAIPDPKIEHEVTEYVKHVFDCEITCTQNVAGTLKFEIPRSDLVLSHVFSQFADKWFTSRVADYSITQVCVSDTISLRLSMFETQHLQGRLSRSVILSCLPFLVACHSPIRSFDRQTHTLALSRPAKRLAHRKRYHSQCVLHSKQV